MNNNIDKQNPTPAYHQLYLILKDAIINGRYKIGSRFPTEINLCQQYNLGRMTVRQALGELENEGFILREQGKGTFVIRSESRSENQFLNIGIIIYKPALEAQWYFPEIISGIHADLENKKVNLILLPFDEKMATIKKGEFTSYMITAKSIKGVIITAEELPGKEISYLQKNNFPFILLNRYPNDEKINYICPDFKGGIRKITEYLISLGHRQIAFIGTLFSRYHLEEIMKKGFMEIMQEKSIKVKPAFLKEADYLGKNVPSLIKQLLQEEIRPTAIICSDDILAVKTINFLHQSGIKVPEEISITGLNDFKITELSHPALTTVRIPRYQIGKEAAGFLYELINKKTDVLHQLVPLELVIRKSCKKVASQIKN